MFPKENLLAFWKLDDLIDSRGNRYTLTNVNGVTFASGKIGQGAVFQLGRSLEALFSPPVPYASGNFSVSCWLKLNTLTNGGKFGADGTVNAFTFGSLTNGTVYIGNNSGNNAIVSSSSGGITTNTWYHLCGVSSNGVVSFYLNGVLIGSNTHTFTSAGKISIAYTYNDNVTDGMFDAVGIWDRPLTLQEVQALYNNGNGLEPEGILFLEDSSTNSLQLTPNGNAKLDTSITKYGGGSAYFDGNGDYIRGNQLFDYSSNFTIEGWVYRTGSGSLGTIFEAGDIQPGQGGVHFYIDGDGTFVLNDGFTPDFQGGTATLNQWVHFAIVRNNNVNTLYINGTAVGSGNQTYPVTNNIFTIGGAPNYGFYFQGYLDDFRITSGIARYTSNFTPPAQQLPDPSDPHGDNVSLLLHMDGDSYADKSKNNFKLTKYGNTKISTSTYKYGGGSVSFDGSGDYLASSFNEAFQFPGDFTVEMWYYPLSLSTNQCLYDATLPNQNSTRSDGFAIAVDSSGQLYFFHNGTPTNASSHPIINTWNHIAVSRSGSSLKVFLNGISVISLTNSVNFSRGGVLISTITETIGSYTINGYIDDLRVTKGVARYTTTFTPPATQLPSNINDDPNFNNVSLLLNFNPAPFTDSSANNFALTAYGNAQIDTAIKKFGSGAALFDGNGDYLEIAGNSTFNFYNTNYTVEMWVFSAASQSGGALITTRLAGIYSPWELQITSSNKIGLLIQNGSSSWYQPFGGAPIVGNATIPQNQWTHIAWVRNGANTTVYVNGVADSGLTNLNIPILQSHSLPSNIYIGRGGDGSFNGYIDELRITKGVARYTANFVPQTAPFANPVSEIPRNGLLVRFNADSGISESGGNITSWTDQQNGVVATAFNNPTLLTNEFNGRKAVSFNGSNTYFTFTFPTPISNGAPRTFVVIGRYNNPATTGQKGYLNSTSGDLCYVFKNANEDRGYYYTEARQIAGPTAASSSSLANYHVQTVVHNGIPNSNFIRINGVTSYNISYGTMNNLPQLTNIVIGGRGTPDEILPGQIVEILIYNRELSSEEITQIETYANI